MTELLDAELFDIVLGWRGCRWRSTDGRALEEKHVHISRGSGNKALEQSALASGAAHVSRVDETSIACVDDEPVTVERTVVDEKWRDGERTEPDRHTVGEKPRGREVGAEGREERCFAQDPRGGFASEDLDSGGQLRRETVVVGMAMADDGGGAVRCHRSQRPKRREPDLVGMPFKRETDIDDEIPAVVLELDTACANLTGSSMNAGSHLRCRACLSC